MNQKHILIAVAALDCMGGAQRANTYLADKLISLGYKVTLAGKPSKSDKIFYQLNSECVYINFNHVLTDYKNNQSYLEKKTHKYKIKLSRSLAKTFPFIFLEAIAYRIDQHITINTWMLLIRKTQPDCIIASLPNSFVPISLALENQNIPLIVNNRNNPWKDYSLDRCPSNVRLKYRLNAPRSAEANVVQLSEYKSFFHPDIQKKTHVIPNAIRAVSDIDHAQVDQIDGIKTIVCTGRLFHVKDHQTLIKAFNKIAEDFHDWQLKIFGEGPLEGHLKKLVVQLDLQESVFICRHTPYLFEEYKNSQIFVLPSLFEGFPNSLAEAMARGIPSIGFNNASGINSLIKNNINGLLVDGENRIDSLAEALKYLMLNPKIRKQLGDAAIFSTREYSEKIIYTQWQNLIDNILKK